MTSLNKLIEALVYFRDRMDPALWETTTVLVSLESRHNTVVSEEDEDVFVGMNDATNQIVISSRIAEDAHMFISFDKEEDDVPA